MHAQRGLWKGGFIAAALALCLGIAACSAGAQEEPAAAPEERVQGGIRYVSGGIGEEERATLAAIARRYSLMLIFRLRGSNEGATDVAISLSTTGGEKVLETVSEGPFFLAKLPPGKYLLKARYEAKTLTRKFVVNKSGKKSRRRLILRWNPAAPTQD